MAHLNIRGVLFPMPDPPKPSPYKDGPTHMGRATSTRSRAMGAPVTLFSSLLLSILLPQFAGIAGASPSTASAQLVFNILKSTKAGGDTSWDAASLVKSVGENWKPDTTGSKKADYIAGLPGQPQGAAAVKQYGGYVDIGDGGKLFYYFVESTAANASHMPLMLWISGGPGCSSVGAGAFIQHGPFLVNNDGKTLRGNPYAWSTASHVIYLDSPVNVGFSYSSNANGTLYYDENKITVGNLRFLLGWMERFPEYKSRDLFLGGDGYAGIFVNKLADLIVEHNKLAKKGDIIFNMHRILLVNPILDVESEAFGIVDFQWTHGLVPTDTWKGVRNKCKATSIRSEACLAEIRKLPVNDLGSGPVYPYDFTASVCNPNLEAGHRVEYYYDCTEKALEGYLSQKEAQRALHGNSPRLSNNGWVQCNADLGTKYQFTTSSSIPIIRRLAAAGVHFRVVSGDADIVVPMVGSRYSVIRLGLPAVTSWDPWFSNDTTVGGFTQTYGDKLIFATMRGAGHMVTLNYPERALRLLQLLFNGMVDLQ